MKKEVIINIFVSVIIVLLYFFGGYHLYVEGISHDGIALFIYLLYTAVISVLLGTISCIWIMIGGKKWYNLLFLSSGLTNLVVSCLFLPGMNAKMIETDSLLALFLFAPMFILTWQIYLVARDSLFSVNRIH